MDESLKKNLEITSKLRTWLDRAGIERSDASATIYVGVPDIIHAAGRVAEKLEELLALDPLDPKAATRALSLVAEMQAWLFTEMKNHLDDLETDWPILFNRISELAPDQTINGESDP